MLSVFKLNQYSMANLLPNSIGLLTRSVRVLCFRRSPFSSSPAPQIVICEAAQCLQPEIEGHYAQSKTNPVLDGSRNRGVRNTFGRRVQANEHVQLKCKREYQRKRKL